MREFYRKSSTGINFGYEVDSAFVLGDDLVRQGKPYPMAFCELPVPSPVEGLKYMCKVC